MGPHATTQSDDPWPCKEKPESEGECTAQHLFPMLKVDVLGTHPATRTNGCPADRGPRPMDGSVRQLTSTIGPEEVPPAQHFRLRLFQADPALFQQVYDLIMECLNKIDSNLHEMSLLFKSSHRKSEFQSGHPASLAGHLQHSMKAASRDERLVRSEYQHDTPPSFSRISSAVNDICY